MNSSTQTINPSRAAWVNDAKPYRPATADPWIDLRLDANEGAPDLNALQTILREFDVSSICRYPDKSKLELLIAANLGISAEEVLVTCGGDDAIDRICRTFLESGKELVLPKPTFAMIPKYAAMTGCSVREVEWSATKFPTDKVIAASNDDTSLIAIVSPNNPTGLVATKEELEAIANASPQSVILLDHAYVEFATEDLTLSALRLPNVITVRTFSKAWGLAGLRVGYVVGNRSLIQSLRCACNPYPVSSVSLMIAEQMYRQQSGDGAQDYVNRVREERVQLQLILGEAGATVTQSQANFVFATLPDAKELVERLASVGIAIRSFTDPANSIRITCPGNSADFERLANEISQWSSSKFNSKS